MQINLASVIKVLQKHKERIAVLGVGLAFLVFIGGGIYLQKNHKREELLIVARPISVELKTSPKEQEKEGAESSAPTVTYFLTPSPDELLDQLASMENLNEDVVNEKFSNLSVLWPVYFFTLQATENGRKRLLLDVSENGFGVVIESEIDPLLYPQLQEMERGKKIWIGGQILAVDPAGTGTIYLKTEQLSIGDEAPLSSTLQKPE